MSHYSSTASLALYLKLYIFKKFRSPCHGQVMYNNLNNDIAGCVDVDFIEIDDKLIASTPVTH